jgi:RNA polymerase sigma-70 factor (ECF subfamily)
LSLVRGARPTAVNAAADGPAADEELARRFTAGDRNAFDELARRHRDALFRFARWQLGADAAEAEDATQDALVEIYRSLPRFEGRSRLRTWMFGLTRNVCGQRRRATRRERGGAAGSEVLQRIPDVSLDLEGALARREVQDAVRAAIESLGPEHRGVILLREIEGLRYEEIAEVLGVPVGTVRSRLHNARVLLAARLAALAPAGKEKHELR